MIPDIVHIYELEFHAKIVANETDGFLNETGLIYIRKFMVTAPNSTIFGETAAIVITNALMFSALTKEL